jgi:hypothetical protein
VRCQSAQWGLGRIVLFVAILSQRLAFLRQAMRAEEAARTRDANRPDHAIANLKTRTRDIEHFAFDLLKNSNGFMAKDAGERSRPSACKRVEIASANRAEADADQGRARFQNRSRISLEPKRFPWTIE